MNLTKDSANFEFDEFEKAKTNLCKKTWDEVNYCFHHLIFFFMSMTGDFYLNCDTYFGLISFGFNLKASFSFSTFISIFGFSPLN